MACCDLVMAFIAQRFALRRKIRQALGRPVGDWYDDEPQPGLVSIWAEKLRGLLRNRGARAILVTLMLGEVAFVAIAAPGEQRLLAEHGLHARQAWEYVQSFGAYVDVSSLWRTRARQASRIDDKPSR
jgi:hypothetical protein